MKVYFKPELIFPILLVALNLGAGCICFVKKDYRKAIYWISAAVLNITVAF